MKILASVFEDIVVRCNDDSLLFAKDSVRSASIKQRCGGVYNIIDLLTTDDLVMLAGPSKQQLNSPAKVVLVGDQDPYRAVVLEDLVGIGPQRLSYVSSTHDISCQPKHLRCEAEAVYLLMYLETLNFYVSDMHANPKFKVVGQYNAAAKISEGACSAMLEACDYILYSYEDRISFREYIASCNFIPLKKVVFVEHAPEFINLFKSIESFISRASLEPDETIKNKYFSKDFKRLTGNGDSFAYCFAKGIELGFSMEFALRNAQKLVVESGDDLS